MRRLEVLLLRLRSDWLQQGEGARTVDSGSRRCMRVCGRGCILCKVVEACVW